MKNLIAILAFIMMSQAQAQQPVQVQVAPVVSAPQAAAAPKKTLIYDERTNQLVEVSPSINNAPSNQAQNNAEATATAVAPSAPAASPIYILNNQRLQGYQGTSQAAIQEQPTTVIVDAPAKASASDSIRKQRAETEAGTEDSIVQALEKARLEDEMRRREKFNAALAPAPAAIAVQQQQQQVVVAAPAAPAAAAVVAQQQQQQAVVVTPAEAVEEVVVVPQKPQKRKKVVVEEESNETNIDVKNEIRLALSERDSKKEAKTSYYVSGLVGMGVYPEVDYVQSALATGFTVGMVTSSNMVIEGAFAYGNYTLGDNSYFGGPTIDMSQYDFSVAAKYQILPGKIRPAVGVIAAYAHRSYESDMSYGCYSCGYQYANNDNITSDSLNAGLTAGLDIALTDNFSLGADFRYLWSIASRGTDENSFNASNGNSFRPQTIDDMAYYMTSVAAKFTF
jgi:Outer membrane protein beta-barrel domain